MTRVLVTGFGPFGTVSVNPSEQVVRALATESPDGWRRVVTAVLETAYDVAGRRVRELLLAERPDVCLLLGVAPGAGTLRLETIARNRAASPSPDVAGCVREGLDAIPDGPPAYQATLPVDRLRERLERTGLPVVLSDDAGGYVCNHAFYIASHTAAGTGATACGFLHVPDDWPQDRLLLAVRTCLDAIAGDG
ncbi:MAG TPA: pyroglutamyl-peptidase I [Candidatus Dormibacteraeota bacterium]|nr:pyroglutamyl-peptidase I [Candidatus Dormibacteraeota bacterium]